MGSVKSRKAGLRCMGDEVERFHRVVRKPIDDENIIEPPKVLMDEINRLAADPRRPPTAIARWATGLWARAEDSRRRYHGMRTTLDATSPDRELMARPSHYPNDFGLDLIPYPNELAPYSSAPEYKGYRKDFIETTCYTSLSVPVPFDPHLHGDMTASTPGFGYMYHGKSPFPDQYDIVTRRGGGPRGGFAWTTGPTEGQYPTSILPQPTFNLGSIGFSNGGSNPEGLSYTNRPKRMRLGGLRNGWPHKVFFVRSSQGMFRNVYGPMSETDATPEAPMVLVNGSQVLHGIVSLRNTDTLNAVRVLSIGVNNHQGKRNGIVSVGDTIQVFCSPQRMANPPLIFTGFVSDVEETSREVKITATDTLGFLSNEIITTEPSISRGDVAMLLKSIVAGSSYAPPIGKMVASTWVNIPEGYSVKGQTRIDAIQGLLRLCNASPNPIIIYCDAAGVIHCKRLPEPRSVTTPLIGGRIPRTDQPQDVYPTNIEKQTGDLNFFNVMTVENTEGTISVTVPTPGSAGFPTRPVEGIVKERNIQIKEQARVLAKQLLVAQGDVNASWIVDCLPSRFDIRSGDVIDFQSAELSGKYRVFRVSWSYQPGEAPEMTLTCGRVPPNLVTTLRYAAGLSL